MHNLPGEDQIQQQLRELADRRRDSGQAGPIVIECGPISYARIKRILENAPHDLSDIVHVQRSNAFPEEPRRFAMDTTIKDYRPKTRPAKPCERFEAAKAAGQKVRRRREMAKARRGK